MGAYSRGGLFGEGLIKKFCTLHGGLFETACFLNAIFILGYAIYTNYNK